jgi:CrcB protein
MEYIAIALGGGIGAMLRYGITAMVQSWTGPGFPFGTLLVNVVGSLLIGFVVVFLHHRYHGNEVMRLFLVIGVLGGFTTFSTFSLDTVNLIESGFVVNAIWNIVVSFSACVFSVYLGMEIARTTLRI